MREPEWIERDGVLALQLRLLSQFGGMAGIRDEGLLESALNRPRQLLNYGEPDLFDLAAAYAYGMVKNHPFLDGNKRAGFMSAYTFLGMNGVELEIPEEEVVLRTLALASGELDGRGYTAWLREACGGSARPRRKRKPRR